ncbi:MAG: endonuclease [Bacillota bacterium]|nr:endonuclease [Bacillota bacterium]
MKVINLIPGSPEWLKSRSASKAPVIMGASNYHTRNELLFQMFSGITKEIDGITQARFDNGHRTEALSREIVEEMIGEDLSPVSASDDDGYLTANFDGVTFPYRIGYEHKDWNEKLAASVSAGIVPDSHAWQLDQQILVGKLDYVIFVVSDGTKDNFASIEYRTAKERTDRLVAAWKQFDIDLANYQHVEEKAAPVADAIIALPSLAVQIKGEVTTSNLPVFVSAADKFLAGIKTVLETDQDFANAEANVKACKAAEDGIEQTKKAITAQAVSIDEVMRTMDLYKEKLANVRLKLDKLVKSEKEARKLAIISKAGNSFTDHVAALQDEIPIQSVRVSLLIKNPNFAGAMKGLKKLSAMQDAVDTELANGKIEADAIAKDVRAKLAWCKDNAAGHSALFPDLQGLMYKPMEDFTLTISSRIKTFHEQEQAKLESERARIQQEEEAKARATVAAEAAAIAEHQRKDESANHVTQSESVENVVQIRPVASARPSRIQMIEAVAQHFKLNYAAAEQCLTEEFSTIKESA